MTPVLFFLRYSDPVHRISNRVISDISVVLRETTLTISDSIETDLPQDSEMMRVVSLSITERIEIHDFNPFPNTPLWDHPKFKEAADDTWNVAIQGLDKIA